MEGDPGAERPGVDGCPQDAGNARTSASLLKLKEMPRKHPEPVRRLGPEDWELAALGALERGGIGAVAIGPLAQALGVTKGSFYWHYENREDLMVSALARWERVHTTEAIEALAAIEDPRKRIERLFEGAGGREPTIYFQLGAAADHPLVAPVLERVTERRLAALAATFRECGLAPAIARERAALAYATYMGLAQLRRDSPARHGSPRATRRLARRAAATLLSP